MIGKTVMTAALAIAALCMATGVQAQQATPADGSLAAETREALTALDEIQHQFDELARSIGVQTPNLRALLGPIFEDAFEGLPDDGSAAFSVAFQIETSVTNDASLEDDPEARPVHADAAACQAAWPNLSIVLFERLDAPGGRGSHCVAHGPSDDAPGAWVMVGEYRIETPQRRLFSRVGASAVAEDDTATAAAIGEGQLSALTALSDQMGRTATDLLLAEPSGDD